jgi:fructokinase
LTEFTRSLPGSSTTQDRRIVAIGEVLWDVFHDSKRLGGAPLNFAAHAGRLGRQVLLISGIGGDALGRSALAAIEAVGLDSRFIQTVRALPTGVARVILGPDGQTSFRIERPAAYDALSLSAEQCSEIAAWSPQWLYHGTLFAHREQPRSMLNQLVAALPRTSLFYDVNLRPGCFSPGLVREMLARADVVKLNESEMAAVAGNAGLPKTSIEEFCATGAARFGWKAVAVTLGGRGCAVWSHGEYVEAPSREVRVADTVGAGDGFAAAMLHGLCCGWTARAIADFANQLGSLIASRPGGIPDWTLDELRIPDQPSGRSQPSTDAAPAAAMVDQLRSADVPWKSDQT